MHDFSPWTARYLKPNEIMTHYRNTSFSPGGGCWGAFETIPWKMSAREQGNAEDIPIVPRVYVRILNSQHSLIKRKL